MTWLVLLRIKEILFSESSIWTGIWRMWTIWVEEMLLEVLAHKQCEWRWRGVCGSVSTVVWKFLCLQCLPQRPCVPTYIWEKFSARKQHRTYFLGLETMSCQKATVVVSHEWHIDPEVQLQSRSKI